MQENANQSELIKAIFEVAKMIEQTNNKMYVALLVAIVGFCLTLTTITGFYFLGDYNVPNQTIQTQSGGNSTVEANHK